MKREQALLAGTGNLLLKFWIPPDVIHVHCDAECAAARRIKLVAQVESMFQRVDAGALGCLHRVQRLDGERHTNLACMFECDGDAVAHFVACACDVVMRRAAGERARQGANHQHEAGCVERPRLVNSLDVVFTRCCDTCCVCGGIKAAAAVAGEHDVVVAQLFGNPVQPYGGNLIAPRADGADAAPGALVDDAVKLPLLAHRRRVEGKPFVAAGEVAHRRISWREGETGNPASAQALTGLASQLSHDGGIVEVTISGNDSGAHQRGMRFGKRQTL